MTDKPRDPRFMNPLYNPEAAARGDPFPFDMALRGLVDPDLEALDFAAVPRLRRRRGGWSEETQRLFILSLSECGCVTQAARSVGMSARSAYRLLDADGADEFARAWDHAISLGIERLRAEAMDRAMNGAWVPVVRRGRFVRFEHRYNDRLAISLLSGRKATIAENRENAVSRRKYRRLRREYDERRAAEKAREREVAAAHQQLLDRIEQERLNPPPRAEPRVRRL